MTIRDETTAATSRAVGLRVIGPLPVQLGPASDFVVQGDRLVGCAAPLEIALSHRSIFPAALAATRVDCGSLRCPVSGRRPVGDIESLPADHHASEGHWPD